MQCAPLRGRGSPVRESVAVLPILGLSRVSVPDSVLESMRAISAQLQAGQLRAANDRLEAIVTSNPGFAEGQRLLASTKLALGDPAAAEALLRHALEVDPAWTPTLTTLGELLLASGRGPEAESVLQRALLAGSPDLRAASVLARHYNGTGRPAAALTVAAPFCTPGRLDPELATQHVTALIALGRQAEALSFYGNVAAAEPSSPAPAQPLAIALNALGRHAEAGQIAHRALARGFRTPTLCLTYARSLMATGANERAETALRDCLRLEPRLTEAHSSLAQLIWMRTGDLAQATEALDQALRTFASDDALRATKAAILQEREMRGPPTTASLRESSAPKPHPCCWYARTLRARFRSGQGALARAAGAAVHTGQRRGAQPARRRATRGRRCSGRATGMRSITAAGAGRSVSDCVADDGVASAGR